MNFYNSVYHLVKKIPRGKVATYGQIASLISTPRAARVVGYALRRSPTDIPWQRVINSNGMISIENINYPKDLQAKLLRREGVKVIRKNENYFVNLSKNLWKPN